MPRSLRQGCATRCGFNYRRLPAVALMQRMIAEGEVGDIRLWRGTWLSDEFADPAIPYDWRFDRDMGGSTIADLGCHLIDMALWMVGPVSEVCAQSTTFAQSRTTPDGQARVTVDDSSQAMLSFESGARGAFEVGRVSVRRPCDFTVEVNGTKGTLVFDYRRLNELRFGSSSDPTALYGMRTIRAEQPSHPYAAHWWANGQGVGYGASFANQVADLLRGWPDVEWAPGFDHAVRVQEVCDAMERSAEAHSWVEVPGDSV